MVRGGGKSFWGTSISLFGAVLVNRTGAYLCVRIAQHFLAGNLRVKAVVRRVYRSKFRMGARVLYHVRLYTRYANCQGLRQLRYLLFAPWFSVCTLLCRSANDRVRYRAILVRGIPIDPSEGACVVRFLVSRNVATARLSVQEGWYVHRPNFRQGPFYRPFACQRTGESELVVFSIRGFVRAFRMECPFFGCRRLVIKSTGGLSLDNVKCRIRPLFVECAAAHRIVTYGESSSYITCHYAG